MLRWVLGCWSVPWGFRTGLAILAPRVFAPGCMGRPAADSKALAVWAKVAAALALSQQLNGGVALRAGLVCAAIHLGFQLKVALIPVNMSEVSQRTAAALNGFTEHMANGVVEPLGPHRPEPLGWRGGPNASQKEHFGSVDVANPHDDLPC